MKNTLKSFLLPLCLVAGFGTTGAALAQSTASDVPDKPQWFKPDPTPQAEYQRKVKEIRAAHRDNLANCKSMPASERRACVKEAIQILKSDLAEAKKASR
jgi:hypothetical protein